MNSHMSRRKAATIPPSLLQCFLPQIRPCNFFILRRDKLSYSGGGGGGGRARRRHRKKLIYISSSGNGGGGGGGNQQLEGGGRRGERSQSSTCRAFALKTYLRF